MKRRGLICTWQSCTSPQIGTWPGVFGVGTISHDKIARTSGRTGNPHQLRRGVTSMPTT